MFAATKSNCKQQKEHVYESSRKERTWECISLGTTKELEEKAPVYEYGIFQDKRTIEASSE
eukprot:3684875-Heterocapsa_arctica.AAC.1